MNPQLLMMMMQGGNDASLLPLLMAENSNDTTEHEDELKELLIYRPLADKLATGFAQKVARMTDDQKAKLLAALSLNMLGSSQANTRFGELLTLSSRSAVMNSLSIPTTQPITSQEMTGPKQIGTTTIGPATTNVIEEARTINVENKENKETDKKRIVMDF